MSDRERKMRPDNPRPTPGVPTVPLPPRILEANATRGRDSRADPTTPPPPPPRVEVEISADDRAVQSMRPRATHAVAKLLAIPAVVTALIAILYAGSGWIDARSKREAAEAALAEARAKQLAELGPRVDAIAAKLAALQTNNPEALVDLREEVKDLAKRMKDAEKDITKLYRARPSRQPDD